MVRRNNNLGILTLKLFKNSSYVMNRAYHTFIVASRSMLNSFQWDSSPLLLQVCCQVVLTM